MSLFAFDDLVRLPTVSYYETAFRIATGMSLKVVQPDPIEDRRRFWPCDNGFCALMADTSVGCAACMKAEVEVLSDASRKLTPQQLYCHAGLTVVAVPVMVGGRHVATLMGGQVLRREPTERDFLLVVKMLGGDLSAEWVRKARKTYFETPVLTAERFQAVLQLLNVFAQYLANSANGLALAHSEAEPSAVAGAKQFVEAHAEEPITLEQVVRHVHVSRFYFCKLFKKATGMTLTEYIARVRVEKAKAMLVDSSLRISEVVFATGFGSIPRFNDVFKRHVGMAPSEYRATLRPQF